MTDLTGVELNEGDYVAFNTSGVSNQMSVGIVGEVKETHCSIRQFYGSSLGSGTRKMSSSHILKLNGAEAAIMTKFKIAIQKENDRKDSI